ncbi:MAG TPA: hypothetical protein VM943_10865, partial [Pyrinomonadaceae bacterium]|nr:hypothetical protein [Pyrinomonadaceae bacterium]
PLVQPRRGTFTEVIQKTGGGLLVEPDDPDALADGLLRLQRDPSLREELGGKGLRGVREHYSVSLMADRAVEVYGSLLKKEAPEGIAAAQAV